MKIFIFLKISVLLIFYFVVAKILSYPRCTQTFLLTNSQKKMNIPKKTFLLTKIHTNLFHSVLHTRAHTPLNDANQVQANTPFYFVTRRCLYFTPIINPNTALILLTSSSVRRCKSVHRHGSSFPSSLDSTMEDVVSSILTRYANLSWFVR